jgi:hypothetical protein
MTDKFWNPADLARAAGDRGYVEALRKENQKLRKSRDMWKARAEAAEAEISRLRQKGGCQ